MRIPTMEIKKIEFYNFGPFYGSHQLEVDVEPDKPLILIRALNDVVKTSFLKAFKFCLYGNAAEPVGVGPGLELDKVPNRKAALEGDGESSVLLAFDHDGDDYEVKRTIHFKKVKEFADPPEITKWNHQIKKHGNMINDPPTMGLQRDFDTMIESWLPKDISTFFFFDVEKSQQYATHKPSPSIIDSIKKILNIKQNMNARDDLETARRKFNTAVNDAQTQDQATKDEALKLEEQRKKLDKAKNDLNVDYQKIKNLRSSINTLREWLAGQAGTAADWKEYSKLETERENNTLNYNSITQRKKEFHDRRLLSEIIQLAVKPTNLSSTNIHDHHEISVAKKHLAENREKCSICDADITDSSTVHLKEVVGSSGNDEDSAKQDILSQISTQSIFDTEHFNLLEEAGKVDDAIYSTETAIKALDEKISSSATSASEEEHRLKQARYDLERGMVIQAQNTYDAQKLNNDEEFNEYRNDVRRNSEKATSDKAIVSQARLNRCEQAMDSFAEIIKTVVEKERATIVETMSTIFTNVTNNPKLYTGLDLDPEYRILMNLQNHQSKPAWIIGPSSGQSAMVAFSFIAALNSRTLAEAPVVIDSPTGKLDPIHRRNIVKYWPKLTRRAGGSGQVFVLYQPDELNEKQFNDMVADHVSHHYRGIRKQDAADESVIVPWDGRWEDDEL